MNRYLIGAGAIGLLIAGACLFNVPERFTSPVAKGKDEEKAPLSKGENQNKEKGAENRPDQALQAEKQTTSKFSEVDLQKPFDKYLMANPLLMEIAGAKIIRQKNGNPVVPKDAVGID